MRIDQFDSIEMNNINIQMQDLSERKTDVKAKN